MKRTSFLAVSSEGLVSPHRTVQLQLLQHYWLAHRLGLLWYWMVSLGNQQRSFCRFWDCIQRLHPNTAFQYWNTQVGSQEIPGARGKFGLWVQNEAGQRLTEFWKKECIGHSKYPLPTSQEKTTHGHHQMVNTKIRLVIFFVAKNGEALYSQKKQDLEMTVAQIMKSLLPNSDLNWRK